MHVKNLIKQVTKILVILLFVFSASYSYAATPAGYSEYFIPGDEGNMYTIFNTLDAAGLGTPMHTIITVTAWSNNTTIYYDHWENGYNFDPANPTTADETYTLNQGQSMTFESGTIGLPRTIGTPPSTTCNNYRNRVSYGSSTTCYDGGDHIYVAGGVVTVTRGSYIEGVGIGAQAAAWEIYPVKPQLTTYVLPFGENQGFFDFNRVFVLVQATEDNTTVTVDLNGDGAADILNINRDATWNNAGDGTTVTLNRGQTFLLDSVSACVSHANCTTVSVSNQLPAGAVIQGNKTLQVKYIAGNPGQTYVARGFSAFPRGFWTKDYYAPLDQPATAGQYNTNPKTDYYLYNPNASAITINWESLTSSGTFNIPAKSTVSFRANVAAGVPVGSGLYFKGTDVFWGVGVGDSGNHLYEWGFSLLPSTMLFNEHFLGWAPDDNTTAANAAPSAPTVSTDMGIFLTVAQDNTTVFIDNGIAVQTYTLNRLQTQFIVDPTDGDLTQAHIWATGPFTMAYGQNADTARTPGPPGGIDLGYVSIPGSDFVSLVLTVDKTVNPQVVPTAIGSVATFTIKVDSQKYTIDGVNVTDYLPPNWQYLTGTDTATITWPDMTTHVTNPSVSGVPATGQTLSWTSAQLGTNGTPGMATNQEVTITFTARTTAVLAAGTMSQNRVKAVGTRTFGTPSQTQTFTAADFVYVASGNLQITKTSNAATPLYPGDAFTYTTTVTNPAGSGATLTGVTLYDALPVGVTSVAGTTVCNSSVGDRFGSVAYSNNDGTQNWVGNWVETNDDNAAGTGRFLITGGELQLHNVPGAVPTVTRTVNLTGASTATLTYSYRQTGADAGDDFEVYVNGNRVRRWTGAVAAGTDTIDISAYIGAATTIQFRSRANTDFADPDDYFFVDNVFVTFTFPSISGNPPELLSGQQLAAGQSITCSFNVTVDNPLATGIESITNTASTTSTQLPLQVSASVTNIVVNPSSKSAGVGDKIWLDSDGDGIQEVGEPGLANVEVTLKDQYGTPVTTTTTDGTGHYLFTGIKPGNGYYVEVTSSTLPSGLQQSAPSGHTDNRTSSFNLINGQFYTDADLGYKSAPGSAVVGNIVWSDANSSGTRNAGEPGLAGVTVRLYRDTNSNGIFEPGTDTLWGTTTTAADGSYLFTGVPASGTEDYFVYVDGAQASLTGYTRISPANDPLYINNLSAGNVVQYANFGYHSGTTYSIKDRIWFDADGNGLVNGSESGIAGVTVDLLDASHNAIATTTTDANGYFTFSGVIGSGADYTIRITDTNALLANDFGTTAAAIAGSETISNLNGNIDYSATPHFGYNLTRSIGDTVFNDNGIGGGTAGDGIQNGSEPGIAGVTVLLYLDDGDNVFEPGIGAGRDGNPIATVVTNSNGRYLFSGLTNGTYWVHIDNTQSTLSGFDTLTTADDSGVAGHQRRVPMSGPSVLNIDYGYRATANRSVSGRLWYDTNNNGVIDGVETGIAGVTISLLQGSNVLASTSTDSGGNYSFTGLPSNTYTVKITDNTGVLSGYIGTYEKTEGTTGPFNAQETVVLTSGNQTAVSFGYVSPAVPTLVVLSSFGAHLEDGHIVIEWETASEKNTLGFYIMSLDTATGVYRSITEGLLPGLLTDPKGGTYTLIDRGAFPGVTYQYKLIEVERDGKQIVYGPFSVSVGSKSISGSNSIKTNSVQAFTAGSTSAGSDYSRRARQQSAVRESLIQTRKVSENTVFEQQQVKTSATAATGSRVKIPVAEDGLYYIDAADISAVTGINSSTIKSWIGVKYLSMSNQGRPVAYLPALNNMGIFFYGIGTDSVYTRNNIYWIDTGKGLIMKNETGSVPAPPAAEETFSDSLHIEKDVFPNMSQTNNPAEDYWDWDLIYLSPAYSDGPKSFKFLLNGKADTPNEASLQVHLVGGSDSGISNDHHVVVKLNGQQIGKDEDELWGGLNPYTFTATFNQSLLNEGENTIEVEGLRDAGIPFSMFLIDSFDLTYERLYESEGDRLFFKGDGNQSVRVKGFTSTTPDILLFNVTNPGTPGLNTSAITDGSTGNYGISFKPVSPDARYLAIARDAAVRVVNAQGANPSSLRSRSNMADYLIIAPNELASAVKPLADYRLSQGMRSKVVTVDDIMNEFNFGLSSPEAIRQFLTYAYKYWSRPPKYVLLAGGGTWDYKDNEGEGGNLIPPAMVPTSYGLSTSDNYLADINGDHVPEMAIGRLPVLTPQEMQNVIGKIKTFEATANNRVIMVADNPDEGGDFSSDSEIISGLFSSRYLLEKVYLGEYTSIDIARLTLLNYINSGSVFFNYIGHASFDMLTAEGLFTSDDIASLANGTRLPVVTAMTCTAGEFAIPGYPTISQLMLLKNGGGAVAFWSATGLSDNAEAKILNREFYTAVLNSNKRVLGDAVLQAFSKYKTSGSMPFMMDIYTILGDPALKLR